MQRQYTNDWNFPDLNAHQSDCSNVTNEQLKNTIGAHWPIENGVAKIPYSFSMSVLSYFLRNPGVIIRYLTKNVYPLALDQQNEQLFRENIKKSLSNWEIASAGTIKFYEAEKINLWSPSLHFYATNQDALTAMGAGAFAETFINNNGDIESAVIFFPNEPNFMSVPINMDKSLKAWAINTYHHEVGHTLGFQHLHEYPDIKDKLIKMTDGVFCSVMPYLQDISSEVSACNKHCDPSHAVLPAALDIELININYKNNLSSCGHFNREKVMNYFRNSMTSHLSSFFISGMHTSIYTFSANLAIQPNKPVFSTQFSHIIADGSLLGAMIYLEMPISVTGVFLLTAAIKYIPELPNAAKSLLTNHYSVHILNFSLAFMKGQCFLPWVCTTIAAGVGSIFGAYCGEQCGKFVANTCNNMTQAIYTKYFQSNEILESKPDCNLDEVVVDLSEVNTKNESNMTRSPPLEQINPTYAGTNNLQQTSSISSNINSYFNTARNRICNFFENNPEKNIQKPLMAANTQMK